MLIQKVKYRFFEVIFLSLIMIAGLAGVTHSAEITVNCSLGVGNYDKINDAIANAFPGDTIKVYPCQNNYAEAVVIDKNLTLRGMGPQKVIIDSPTHGITVNSDREVTITGFFIRSANHGINLLNNSITTISNNCIVSNIGSGIYTVSTSIDTVSYIINNTIALNGQSGIILAGSTQSYKATFYVSNNIVFDNAAYGITKGAYNLGTVITSYNNVFANFSDFQNISPNPTDISVNPLFLNPPIGACILRSDSPCINAGSPGLADYDPDGSRNDMGTYGAPSSASSGPIHLERPSLRI